MSHPDSQPTPAAHRARQADPASAHVFAEVRAAAAACGRNAADWWAQDTIGARATGDLTDRARHVLAGVDSGDPAVLDELPHALSALAASRPGEADPDAADLPPAVAAQLRDDRHAEDTFIDGYTEAMLDRVAELCRIAISPRGDGRDMSHLHPDGIRIGRAGVFSGDWSWTSDDGPGRYRVGYAGTLIDRWNGWAVFSCTRKVAEAIVAEQQTVREQYRNEQRHQGKQGADLESLVDQMWANLYFDGDVIVADQRQMYDDPEAIDRIMPDADGRYVVMGWNWCWDAVDPLDCERIVGDLPEPGDEQQYVLLRHTPGMQVPHDRLRATDVQRHVTDDGAGFTAILTLDGTPVATITNPGNGGATTLTSLDGQPEWQGMADYLAGAWHQGAPVEQSRLLIALVTETELDDALTRAAAADAAVLRLIDDHGYTREVSACTPAPRGWQQLIKVGDRVTADSTGSDGTRWQIWTGRHRQTLPTTATAVTIPH
ncbi:hypothetical protein AB0368_06705 [Actinoplanes sp. NPDC051475]|uniref:hypothetical protein n=1 Tax=Actinoplanes sp. NPDC051475 TaxID=3157225 RepID=UPI00344E16BB